MDRTRWAYVSASLSSLCWSQISQGSDVLRDSTILDRVGQKWVYNSEYVRQSLFLLLLITVIFSIWTMNLLLPHPVCAVRCALGQSGPKSPWSCPGPFSWLPHREWMGSATQVGWYFFPVSLTGLCRRGGEYKIIPLSFFLFLECLSTRILLFTKRRMRFLNSWKELKMRKKMLAFNSQQFAYTF